MGTRWWEGKKNNRPWIILTLADLRCWGATVKKRTTFIPRGWWEPLSAQSLLHNRRWSFNIVECVKSRKIEGHTLGCTSPRPHPLCVWPLILWRGDSALAEVQVLWGVGGNPYFEPSAAPTSGLPRFTSTTALICYYRGAQFLCLLSCLRFIVAASLFTYLFFPYHWKRQAKLRGII